jgi:hypothetical protein
MSPSSYDDASVVSMTPHAPGTDIAASRNNHALNSIGGVAPGVKRAPLGYLADGIDFLALCPNPYRPWMNTPSLQNLTQSKNKTITQNVVPYYVSHDAIKKNPLNHVSHNVFDNAIWMDHGMDDVHENP